MATGAEMEGGLTGFCVCVIFDLPPEPMKKWAVVPAFLESPTDMYVRIYREPAVMGSWR
jgi:hypothetical protein